MTYEVRDLFKRAGSEVTALVSRFTVAILEDGNVWTIVPQ